MTSNSWTAVATYGARARLLTIASADRVLARLASGRGVSPERLKVSEGRLRVLDRIGHDGYILGTGKFARYKRTFDVDAPCVRSRHRQRCARIGTSGNCRIESSINPQDYRLAI